MKDQPLSLPTTGRCSVFPARDFRVETGAFSGDAIGDLSEVVDGDIYRFDHRAVFSKLAVTQRGAKTVVANRSRVGNPGQLIRPLARHQIMGERCSPIELLILDVEGARLALPSGLLSPSEEYTLIRSVAVDERRMMAEDSTTGHGSPFSLASGLRTFVDQLRPQAHRPI